jgi:hypothetical protein
VAGDLDARGNSDDLFLRDAKSGDWIVLNWSDGKQEEFDPTLDGIPAVPTQVAAGRWLPDWDRFVIGDWDTDGRLDDMYLYDIQGGGWTNSPGTATPRRTRSSPATCRDWTASCPARSADGGSVSTSVGMRPTADAGRDPLGRSRGCPSNGILLAVTSTRVFAPSPLSPS